MTANEKDTRESVLAEKEEILAACEPARFRVLRRMAQNPDNRLVLGFGGGSVPGLVGNCALAAILEELDVLPHVREVWGVSAGAVVGGALASGTQPQRVLDHLSGMKTAEAVDVDYREIFWKGIPRFLFARRLPDGLVRGRRFREAIERSVRVDRIEDTPIPFRCIACSDDGHARKVIFREGPIVDAICASMCIPGVMLPIESWRGDDFGFFDGALVEKTPLLSVIAEHKREGRPERLVILATHFDIQAKIRRPRGFVERFLSTLWAMEELIWESQVTEARQTDARFVMLNPQMEYGGMFDFEEVPFNYLWCRKRFKEQLSNARLTARLGAR